MLIISLFEGVGLFLLVPLIGLTGILDVSTSEVPLYILALFIISRNSPNDKFNYHFIIIYLINNRAKLFSTKQMILNAKIHQGFIRHLREETYKRFIAVKLGFFFKKKKTDIINFMTT